MVRRKCSTSPSAYAVTWPGSWISLPLAPRRAEYGQDVGVGQLGGDGALVDGRAPDAAATGSRRRRRRSRPGRCRRRSGLGAYASSSNGSMKSMSSRSCSPVRASASAIPGPSSRSSSGITRVPHPRPGEARIGVLRVLPPGDALGPAGRLGLRPGSGRAGGGRNRPVTVRIAEVAPHPLQRPATGAPRQPEQHGLRLVVERVAEEHQPGLEVLRRAGRGRRTWPRGLRPRCPRTRGRRSPGSTRSRRRRGPPSARPPSPCARPSPPAGRGRR